MSSSILDYISSSAVSLTVSGNTGISPFLTLFLLGVIERSDPDLLKMDGWIEQLLSSWPAIIILGLVTGLELMGHCIPVLDEFIDSIEVFIVPVLSIFGSLGTMGLLDAAQAAASGGTGDGGRRLLVGDGMLYFLKAVLVITGIVLALCIHLFKMLIRIIGLTCCAGCCQPCITMVEISCVLVGIFLAVFVRQLAIITCIILLGAAGFAIYKKFIEKKDDQDGEGDNQGTTTKSSSQPGTPSTQASNAPVQQPPDIENQVEIPVIVLPATPKEGKAPHVRDEGELPPPVPVPPANNPEYVEVQLSTRSQEEEEQQKEDSQNKDKGKGKGGKARVY